MVLIRQTADSDQSYETDFHTLLPSSDNFFRECGNILKNVYTWKTLLWLIKFREVLIH